MNKKFILVLSLLLCSCNTVSENGTINFEVNENELTAIVTSSKSFNKKELVIPNSIQYQGKDYAVTGLAIESFKGNKFIEKVVLPASIKNIGYDAFRNCSNLKSVDLGGNVEVISDHLFSACTSLKEVLGTENVKQILYGSFENTHLETIKFDNLSFLGIDSFFNNQYLKEVTLLGDLTTISGSSFERCSSLERVQLSSSVTNIGNYAFNNCSMLNKINLENIKEVGKFSFAQTSLNKLELNDTEIGDYAFYNCPQLSEINLSSKVISYSAFKDCVNLENISLENVEEIGSQAFYKTNLKKISFPNTLKIINSEAFAESKLEEVDFLQSQIKRISRRAFYHTNLKGKLLLPKSLEFIYNEAFAKNSLEEVSIYNNTNYDSNAFDDNVKINISENI